jgi:hypothetical protein
VDTEITPPRATAPLDEFFHVHETKDTHALKPRKNAETRPFLHRFFRIFSVSSAGGDIITLFLFALPRDSAQCYRLVAVVTYIGKAGLRMHDMTKFATRSKAPRSRTTSRRAVLFGVDGRSMQARRFKDLIDEFQSDLGGREILSEGERQMVRRCAMLSAECEKLEAEAALSGEFDAETYGMLCDRLGRALSRVGLKRRPRDVTPTINDIVARHHIEAQRAAPVSATKAPATHAAEEEETHERGPLCES